MNLKAIKAIAEDLSGLLRIPVPAIDWIQSNEVPRDVYGAFYLEHYCIVLRRNQRSFSWPFLIGHELFHAWQYLLQQPFNEDYADQFGYFALYREQSKDMFYHRISGVKEVQVITLDTWIQSISERRGYALQNVA